MPGLGTEVRYSNMVIKNNIIHDCGRRNIALDTYGGPAVVTNVIVDGNTCYHGFHTTGIDLIAAGNCTMARYEIKNNFIYDDISETLDGIESFTSNGMFISNQGSGTVTGINIHNNVIKDNTSTGIDVNNVDSVYLYNNTIYGVNPNLEADGGLWVEGSKTNVVLKNNIIYNNTGNASTYSCIYINSGLMSFVSDYNLFYNTLTNTRLVRYLGNNYTTSQWTSYLATYGQDKHSRMPANPLFVSTSDFHLQSTSPAIGAGADVGLAFPMPRQIWEHMPSISDSAPKQMLGAIKHLLYLLIQ